MSSLGRYIVDAVVLEHRSPTELARDHGISRRGFRIPAGGRTLQDPTLARFQLALEIAPPWEVDRLEFDPDQHRLDIRIGFQRGARFACPEGDSSECPVHDTTEKEGRHLNFF